MGEVEREALQRDPYPAYARARRAQGLIFEPELDAWLVTRYDDVREVLRHPEDFSSANALRADFQPTPDVIAELSKGIGGYPAVLTSDGAAHQRYRAPVVRGLTPSRVAAALPFIAERAESLIGSFAGDGEVELMGAYAGRLPGEVIGHLMGLDPGDVPVAVAGSRRLEELLFRPMEPEDQILAAREAVEAQHLLDRYARRRRETPGDDMCTEMVRGLAPGTDELTREQRGELVSNLQNLLLAGQLTTTALIGTTVLHLLRHPDQWKLLCARPELVPAAVDEAARYDTAIQAFRRITTRPVTLAGAELPAGATVMVAFGSANRDEAMFDRPDAFDITREPARHMAFGHGVHACPGAQLAREQLRITLETLIRLLPGLRLSPSRQIVMRPTLIHRSPEALPLTW